MRWLRILTPNAQYSLGRSGPQGTSAKLAQRLRGAQKDMGMTSWVPLRVGGLARAKALTRAGVDAQLMSVDAVPRR